MTTEKSTDSRHLTQKGCLTAWGLMPEFVQLKRDNNWGHITIVTEDNRPVTFNERVRVMWPDQSITEEDVVIRPEYNTVHDHGNTYRVHSKVPSLQVNFHGANIFVCIHEVKVAREDFECGEPSR